MMIKRFGLWWQYATVEHWPLNEKDSMLIWKRNIYWEFDDTRNLSNEKKILHEATWVEWSELDWDWL